MGEIPWGEVSELGSPKRPQNEFNQKKLLTLTLECSAGHLGGR